MKKWLILLIIFAAVAIPAQAQSPIFSLDIGAALNIGLPPPSSNPLLSTIVTLMTLRFGPLVDLTFILNDMMNVGVEAGLYIMAIEILGTSILFVELPIRAVFRLYLGPFMLQPHAGIWIPIAGMAGATNVLFDVGAKVGIGSKVFVFFLEASYVFPPAGYPRIGLGFLINLLRV